MIEGIEEWTVTHLILFRLNGQVFQADYRVGATESQDEQPWEYNDEIELTEMIEVQKTVTVWEKK